jgi:hypothetical protein
VAFDFTYPTPLPSTKGWGPGWPNCDLSKIVPHPVFQGGVRAETLALVDILVAALTDQGYEFHAGWSWGYGCRATKTSSGPTTATPSFHSWGLALDFNAPLNVFGADRLDTQLGKPEFAWVMSLMRTYGYFWLGPSIGDWMHFSFCGSPADAEAMTVKAQEELMKDPRVDSMLQAITDYNRSQPHDPNGDAAYDKVYKALTDAASKPRPDATVGLTKTAADALYAPIIHDHSVVGKAR